MVTEMEITKQLIALKTNLAENTGRFLKKKLATYTVS